MRTASSIPRLVPNWRRHLVWPILLVALVAARPELAAAQDTVFVSVNGFPGGNPGNDLSGDGTRLNPFREITAGMAYALGHGKHVIFAGPTGDAYYTGPIEPPYDAQMKFVSEKGADSTLLQGTGGAPVVTLAANTVVQALEGFTIADNTCPTGCPGGISAQGRVWLINNKILRNVGDLKGGGIYYSGSEGIIAGNWIGGNSDQAIVSSTAGGICLGVAIKLMIVNNTIVDNTGKTGAGILLTAPSMYNFISNNIIAFNHIGYGIYSEIPIATIPKPTYCLFYDNDGGDAFNFQPIDYDPTDNNHLGEDPLFVDYNKFDYHLACKSPAMDNGSASLVPIEILADFSWDIDGYPQGRFGPTTVIDIGGDEFWDTHKKADFVASATAGCTPLLVEFTNKSLCLDEQWIWDFGEGAAGPDVKNPIHSYDTAGIYTIRLVARGDLDSDTLTLTKYIQVSKPLTTDFTADVVNGCTPLTVQLTADLNTDADSVVWSFGDDQTATGSSITHVYTKAGKYSVGLTAFNICGAVTRSKVKYINVGSKPSISIAASSDADSLPPLLCSPCAVRLHPVTDQPLIGYVWDFGDSDTTDALQSDPSHVYKKGGTYSVRLIGTGDCGIDTAIRLGYVEILSRPTATLSADPVTGCAGDLTVNFSATYVGSVSSSKWLYGDGESAPGPSAQHVYSDLGVYHPQLVLVHDCGEDTLSLSAPITVGVPPVAVLSGEPRAGYEPLTVHFADLSTNAPATWYWTFGDKGTTADEDPVHVYALGVFDVSLAVSNACGNSTVTMREYVHVGGFQPSLDSAGVHGDTILYSVVVDTFVLPYDQPVSLSGALTTVPRRGSLAFAVENPAATPRFVTTMRAVPSGDLAAGDYIVQLSAADQRITKTATRSLHFAGRQFISATPDTIRFGTRAIGGSYGKHTYIRNGAPRASGFTLRITASVTGQDFDFIAPAGTVNPQESTAVQVLFAPTRRGDYTGTLTINSDDPVQPVYQVPLRGRGTPDMTPPQVSATVPPTAFDEIRIDSPVRFVLNEPVVAASADSLVLATDQHTGGPVSGEVTFSSGSPTQPWNWMEFSPLLCQWFLPDDTVSLRVRAVIVDTSGNYLDGNKNGADEGSPTDDYLFSVSTGPGVRPGDADQNRRVDERDILPLARFWGMTGPSREDPCPGFTVQPASTWTPREATHADADGNGVIDSMDICPIAQYFDVDSSLSKAAVETWMTEARNWDNRTIRALIGGLINCPQESRGREALHRFLDGLQTVAAVPLEFSLAQNYPNPFNPATVIEYTLKSQTKARLEVFDIQGRLVAVLQDSEQQAGRHSCLWDGHDSQGRPLASGIYFYRLVTPEFRLARKMVLMK